MLSLLYVSRAHLLPDTSIELEKILKVAVKRNLVAGITGALVYAGADFAQMLEGPEAEVAQVMASILIDQRHRQVTIVRREEVPERSFPNWGMALIGHLPEIQTDITSIREASNEHELNQAIERLTRWLRKGASAQLKARSDG